MRLDANAEVQIDGYFDRDRKMFRMSITERKSNTAVLEVEIPAADLLGLIGGSVRNHPAWITPFFDRLGKTMRHRTEDVPREELDGLAYDQREPVVRAWGEARAQNGETVETRSTNTGWKVIFRSYHNEED